MKRLALAAVAVVSLLTAWTATAAPDTTHTQNTAGHVPPACTIGPFRGFSQKVWRLPRWERGAPKKATFRAAHRRMDCAPPGHRAAMQKRWAHDRAAYNAHRRTKLHQRRLRRAHERYLAAITPPGPDVLAAIRSCESGGVYSTDTGNGFYGAYQFTLSTWASVGGSGNPALASPQEQDERAAELYRRSGSSPWPVCGV